jgi:hypothetical protein
MESENTWEHPFTINDKTEPTQSFEAFQIWLEMGTKRSLKAVAERVEKSHDTIKKYSCTWKWSERLQDKLSYENKQIHAKQLESVMTSLDIDNNRDIFLQEVLGNIMYDLGVLSQLNVDKFKTVKDGKIEPSVYFEMLERLINMYAKLEKVHYDNQQKFIDMNESCLKVYDFDQQADYIKVLLHGRKQHLNIKNGFFENRNDQISRGVFNPESHNISGEQLVLTPPYNPLNKYNSNKSKKVEQAISEDEVGKLE